MIITKVKSQINKKLSGFFWVGVNILIKEGRGKGGGFWSILQLFCFQLEGGYMGFQVQLLNY